jgi:hypothetical protein
MQAWLREVLDESTENVSNWPAWKRQSEMLDDAATSDGISADLDLVETSIAVQVVAYPYQEHL